MKYYEKNFTQHQINKFTRAFRSVVDVNDTGKWDHQAVDVMVESMRKFARKERGDEFYKIFAKHGKDVFDYMQADMIKHKEEYGLNEMQKDQPITLELFLNVHAHVVKGKTKMEELPSYLQDLPKVFFTLIDRDVDDVLTTLELSEFFRDFTHVPEEECMKRAEEAWNEWTEGGKYPMTLDRYAKVFEDFLVATQPTGPGRLLFGHPEE